MRASRYPVDSGALAGGGGVTSGCFAFVTFKWSGKGTCGASMVGCPAATTICIRAVIGAVVGFVTCVAEAVALSAVAWGAPWVVTGGVAGASDTVVAG